mgnify:CR=1 FL=1
MDVMRRTPESENASEASSAEDAPIQRSQRLQFRGFSGGAAGEEAPPAPRWRSNSDPPTGGGVIGVSVRPNPVRPIPESERRPPWVPHWTDELLHLTDPPSVWVDPPILVTQPPRTAQGILSPHPVRAITSPNYPYRG